MPSAPNNETNPTRKVSQSNITISTSHANGTTKGFAVDVRQHSDAHGCNIQNMQITFPIFSDGQNLNWNCQVVASIIPELETEEMVTGPSDCENLEPYMEPFLF